MNENDNANVLSARENAHERKPDAYLKTWFTEDARGCRVDLTDICEPWLDALKPEIVPLYRRVPPPDVDGFLKGLRGLLVDVSQFNAHEGASTEAKESNALADRAEAMLSQVVALEGIPLPNGDETWQVDMPAWGDEDRRIRLHVAGENVEQIEGAISSAFAAMGWEQRDADLAALLKAAHEVVDADDPASLSEAMPALQAATLPYQDRVDLFTEPEEIFHPENVERSMHPAELARTLCTPASSSTNAEDLEDDLEEVISDTIDMDWQPRWAARAVVDYLTARNHPVTKPGMITPAVAIHRLSIMARVAEREKRLGDVQSIRDAMRIIGELQSHVTRLNPDGRSIRVVTPSTTVRIRGERRAVEEFDPLPLDGQ